MAMLIRNPATRRRIFLAALLAATATIPLFNNLNSVALIFLVFACLLQQPLSAFKKNLAAHRLWLIPVVYFVWLACTYFWDTSGGFAIRDIERYAMLFFLPPVLAAVPRISARELKITGAVFISVTVAVCVACLVRSYIEYQHTHDYRLFSYHYLASQMDLNAIFLSNYCLAGMVWMSYYAFAMNSRRRLLVYVLYVLVCVFLFSMILLLSSKLIIFLTLLLLVFILFYVGYLKKRFILTMLVAVSLIAGLFVAVNHLGYLRWRMATTSVKQYQGQSDDQNGLSIRLLMWRTAWELVREKPLQGYGVKGARVEVLQKYKAENFMLGYNEGYHSHNQYLQSALAGGIPAFLLLMSMLVRMAWQGLRNNNVLLMALLLHFMSQSVIESTFEVQQELSFYMLFLFLFYYHPPFQKPEVSAKNITT